MTTIRITRTSGRLAAVALVAVGLAACGGDDGDDGASIGSIDEWCAIVEDVDARFETTDNSSDAFEEKQADYEEINGLLHDLEDSIELVESEARPGVGEALGWAITFTDVLVDAESEDEAVDELFGDDGLYAEAESMSEAGPAWILDTCGVDIDGEG